MMAWYQKQQRNCRVTFLAHWKIPQTWPFLLWKDLENSNAMNSALGRDRQPSLQSYEQERTWFHQAPPITDAENDFSPRKINQNQWFVLQNTQWDDDTATIHTCLGGEGFPGTIHDAKVLMVGGGRRRRGGARGGVHKWAILAFWEAPLKKLLRPTFT
jgi:hypothetical protein